MQINKKQLALVIALTAILTLSSNYYIHRGLNTLNQGKPHQNPTPKDNVYIFFETTTAKWNISTGNVITDIGETYTRGIHAVNQTNINAIHWISIGNATAGTGLTQLTSEYDRQLGTIANWTDSGDQAFNVTYTWTFTETQRINCAGGHWEGSGNNNLYSVANFDDTTFNLNDNMTVRYCYTYDCN